MVSKLPPNLDQEQINRQIRAWILHENFSSAAEALRSLPLQRRSSDIIYSFVYGALDHLAFLFQSGNIGPNGTLTGPNQNMLADALDLLESIRFRDQEDPTWNCCMGMILASMCSEGDAIVYFQRCLQGNPGDGDASAYLESCIQMLSMPDYPGSFRSMVQACWEAFRQEEPHLRELMSGMGRLLPEGELTHKTGGILQICFDPVTYQIGHSEEGYILTLGLDAQEFMIPCIEYFRRCAPKEVLAHWSIRTGLPGTGRYQMPIGGLLVKESQLLVHLEPQKGTYPLLLVYSPRLTALLSRISPELDPMEIVSLFFSRVLGDIPTLCLLDSIRYLDRTDLPSDAFIPLNRLPVRLKKLGLAFPKTPARFLQSRLLSYTRTPDSGADAPPRADITHGETQYPSLLQDYESGRSHAFNFCHHNSIALGYFYWPIGSYSGEAEQEDALARFRRSLEDAISASAGDDAFTVIGWAVGLRYAYLDFFAWDFNAVLDAVKKFLRTAFLSGFWYHGFRQDLDSVSLGVRPSDVRSPSPAHPRKGERGTAKPRHRNNIIPLFGGSPSSPGGTDRH